MSAIMGSVSQGAPEIALAGCEALDMVVTSLLSAAGECVEALRSAIPRLRPSGARVTSG